ncbi:uncharacterized protein TEOVI_000757800 [Trypanosoma equiperdum]|uniref:Trypanosome variant surface glycoprotein (A-type) n=1 Tax=Trypanosoma equiperdum TaxID=5694 RepID=A0A1G4I2N1_TRYEQ|nr:hypothetical protein, conserved [Trypanosoma equiperdum]
MLTQTATAVLVAVLMIKAPTEAAHTKQDTVVKDACKAARSFEKLKDHIAEQTRDKMACLASYTAARRHLILAAAGAENGQLATAAAALLVYGDTQAAQLHSQL